MPQYSIRPARVSDSEAIEELLDLCGVGDPNVGTSTLVPTSLVATCDGVLIGFVHLIPGSPYAFITLLAVHPDHQKLGTASALLRVAVDSAMQAGATTVLGTVALDNHVVNDNLPGRGWELVRPVNLWKKGK